MANEELVLDPAFHFEDVAPDGYTKVYLGMENVISPNGNCEIPSYPYDRVASFLQNCTPAKFMNPANPECSCGALNASFPDFVVTISKSGSNISQFGTGGSGGVWLYAAVILLLCFIVTSPLTLWISYRMSRKEIAETRNSAFFMRWHRQKTSSFISLVLIVLGVVLLFASVSGQSEVDLAGLLKITSVYPGLIAVVLGFFIWLTTIRGAERPQV